LDILEFSGLPNPEMPDPQSIDAPLDILVQ
jgi:hypothetical protein